MEGLKNLNVPTNQNVPCAVVPDTALLLVGGEGTRLRPITYEIPKALIPIHGKALTEHIILFLKRYGVKRVILAVGYLKEKVKAYFGDGSKLGIEIVYVEENTPLGTGGPLKLARPFLKNTNAFICGNGDELKSLDIAEMYEQHKKTNALATLALREVEDPSIYGVVRMDHTKILEFVEKPKKEEAPSNFINAGFYILEPEIISMVLDVAPEEMPCSFERDIFPRLAKMSRLHGYVFNGQWFDVGNLERYEKALKEWNDSL